MIITIQPMFEVVFVFPKVIVGDTGLLESQLTCPGLNMSGELFVKLIPDR